MSILNIVLWIVFGFTAGLIAHLIDPAPDQGGFLGTTLLGIVGAIVGGFLANAFFGLTVTGFNLTSLIIAVGGSLLLLFVGRAFRRV